MPSLPVRLAGLLAFVLAVAAPHADAEVFYAKDEALALAFPDTNAIEAETVFLTDEQVAAVRAQVGVELDSHLFTYYVARRGDAVLGYAVIDTHTVRTLPETFLVVLGPEGTISRLMLLAFYEPREYMPPQRWLTQFEGRDLTGSGWRLGHDIHGISGATLTARALPQALRKILALYRLVIQSAGP